METVKQTKELTPRERLDQIIKEKGLTPEKQKKALEELKEFWNERIGLTYEEVRKRAWR